MAAVQTMERLCSRCVASDDQDKRQSEPCKRASPAKRCPAPCRRPRHGPVPNWPIIPARAGNAQSGGDSQARSADHPRAGGERQNVRKDIAQHYGSSPHGRGTRLPTMTLRQVTRIIPARAGNAACLQRLSTTPTDHPRTGGERGIALAALHISSGSSPHGRGTLIAAALPRRARRIIPARAGNASDGGAEGGLPTDHPRTGGERRAIDRHLNPGHGSSPHGRGTHLLPVEQSPPRRIIPARAGNASWARSSAASPTDHPRTGGERKSGSDVLEPGYGSSPHGRGTRDADLMEPVSVRIIPARAGNARRSRWRAPWPADHPRTGGERETERGDAIMAHGSSPHGRGTQIPMGGQVWGCRIIPARAGNAEGHGLRARPQTDHPRTGGERSW